MTAISGPHPLISRQTLVGASLAGLFLLLFLGVVAALRADEPLASTDRRVVAFIQSDRDPWLDQVMGFFTDLCSWQIVVSGTAALVIYLAMVQRRLWMTTLLVSVIGDQIIVSTLKALVGRARPDQTIALVPATGGSFPSGHTFAALAFYGLIAACAVTATRPAWARLSIGALALAGILAVGVSRVYLGAHWPSDVLGSFTLGAAWVSAVVTGASAYVARRPERPHRVRRSPLFATGLLVAWLSLVGGFTYVHPVPHAIEAIEAPEYEFP